MGGNEDDAVGQKDRGLIYRNEVAAVEMPKGMTEDGEPKCKPHRRGG